MARDMSIIGITRSDAVWTAGNGAGSCGQAAGNDRFPVIGFVKYNCFNYLRYPC